MIPLEHGLIQVRPVDPCCKLEVPSPEGRFGQLRSCPAIITMFLEHGPQREKRAQYSHSTQPVPLSRSFGISCSDSLFLFGFEPWLALSAGLSYALFAVLSQFLEFLCEFFFSPELLISTVPFLPAAELSVASPLDGLWRECIRFSVNDVL